MMDLSGNMLAILEVAAYLGSTLDQQRLRLVWSKFFNKADSNPRVVEKVCCRYSTIGERKTVGKGI